MRRAAIAFLAMLLGAAIALALPGSGAFASPSGSAGPGQYALAITSVTALTVPQFAASARICVETAAARYTDDGSTPSATVGIPVAVGCFDYAGPLPKFQIIGGSGATLDVSYYK